MATKNKIIQEIADEFGLEYRVEGSGYTRHVLTREERDGTGRISHVQARFLGTPSSYCRAQIFADSIGCSDLDVGRGTLGHKARVIATYLCNTSARAELSNKAVRLNGKLNALHQEAQRLAKQHAEITALLSR